MRILRTCTTPYYNFHRGFVKLQESKQIFQKFIKVCPDFFRNYHNFRDVDERDVTNAFFKKMSENIYRNFEEIRRECAKRKAKRCSVFKQTVLAEVVQPIKLAGRRRRRKRYPSAAARRARSDAAPARNRRCGRVQCGTAPLRKYADLRKLSRIPIPTEHYENLCEK